MTVPRAELSAAVLNARTGHIVQRPNSVTQSTLKQWVRNRIVEIKRLTESDSWKYARSSNMIVD